MERIDEDREVIICKGIIDKKGYSNQVLKAAEELSELSQALCRFLQGEDHNVEEEIADVEIMLNQLKIMFDINDIEKWRDYKLKRLRELTEK